MKSPVLMGLLSKFSVLMEVVVDLVVVDIVGISLLLITVKKVWR